MTALYGPPDTGAPISHNYKDLVIGSLGQNALEVCELNHRLIWALQDHITSGVEPSRPGDSIGRVWLSQRFVLWSGINATECPFFDETESGTQGAIYVYLMGTNPACVTL